MHVQVAITEGSTVCRPSGSLDVYTAPDLREAMAVAERMPTLVVDLSNVPFIDSAGLAALVAGIRRVREGGGQAVVCSPRPHVRRVLHMVGFERVVPIAATLEEAERMVTGTHASAEPVA